MDTSWRSRRKFPRYKFEGRFKVIVSKAGSHEGWSRDISEGGLGGMLAAKLEPEQEVSLEIKLPDGGEPLVVKASVRYLRASRYGFEFITLSPQQRSRILKCVEKMEMTD